MRITEIRERTIPVSRYAVPTMPWGGLDTSIVAVATDAVRDGRPVIGYGFSSIGRYAQGGLIRERFAPRLAAATPDRLAGEIGECDPFRAWDVMMDGEKKGGHGERCVAVGTLDMALWDIASKLAGLPLHALLLSLEGQTSPRDVAVYAAGGYLYPTKDLSRLREEMALFKDLGHTRAKIKIGTLPLDGDLRRVEAATRIIGSSDLAVDAMNAYDGTSGLLAADGLRPFDLMWFEDVCDPLDFKTQNTLAAVYQGALGVGEALFSDTEAALLGLHGGLRRDRDLLMFDPVHCYGLPGFLKIVAEMKGVGWPTSAFWPHGGHLFAIHVVAGLNLGGAEVNPLAFAPFNSLPPEMEVTDGRISLPNVTGIGFEAVSGLAHLFHRLLG